MEINLEILKNKLSFLNDQLHIYSQQGQVDVVERLLIEIKDTENKIDIIANTTE
jgi:hypothetical protein